MKLTKMKAVLAAASLITVAAVAKQADAAVLLSDTFDTYPDQASFVAAWPVVGAQPSGTLSSTQSVTPPNSIHNVGTTVATEAMRNQRTFTESGTPSASNVISFSFDFYDSSATASPYRQHSNLQDGAGPSLSAQLISLGLNNNHTVGSDGGNFYMARILGYTPTFAPPASGTNPATASGAYFKLNDNPALVRSTGWHNLRVDISDTQFQFYVDGQLAETVANTFALRSYDVVRLGSGLSNGGNESYYDNVLVEAGPVPEPTAMLGLGLGGLMLVARRRRATR